MICMGIDVAKDKRDCFILSSEGEVPAEVFTIQNNVEGFDTLLQTIHRCARPEDKIKVGLEATGHYNYNILGFLFDKVPVRAAFVVQFFSHMLSWASNRTSALLYLFESSAFRYFSHLWLDF